MYTEVTYKIHALYGYLLLLNSLGHYRIDSVNRARCPGTGWPRARLFSDLEDDMEFRDVTYGMATIRQRIQRDGMGSLSLDERQFYNEFKWYVERLTLGGLGDLGLTPREMADALEIVPKSR